MNTISAISQSFSRNVLHYKENRNSSIEILRIIAIFFVLIHHWTVRVMAVMPDNEPLYLFLQTFTVVGKIGVDIFFMISGLGMCQSTKFSFNKLLRVCLEVFFYTFGWAIADIILMNTGYLTSAEMGFELSDSYSVFSFIWLEAFNFAGSGGYWFPATYLFIFLIAPFINVVLKKVGKKGQIILCVILFLIVSLLPSIGISGNTFSPLLGLECYVIGATVGLHLEYFKRKRYIGLIFAIAFMAIQMITAYWLYKCHFENTSNQWYIMAIRWQIGSYTYSTCLSALGFVIFFSSFKLKIPLINLIASTTYGIYLFHDGAGAPAINKLIGFDKIFASENVNTALTISFFSFVFGIFFVGLLIDLFRQFLLEKPLFSLLLNKIRWRDIELCNTDKNKKKL